MILREYEIKDEATRKDIYSLISGYVTYGEWKEPNQFDHIFYQLMGLLPRPRTPMTLYRVIRLSDEQRSHYEAGDLTLKNRKFSSWTKNLDIATRLAHTKGDNCIIISEQFPPENIVMDVQDFYDDNSYDRNRYPEYRKYVINEEEVIVHDTSEKLIDGHNSYLFANHVVADEPQIGDKVFYDAEDEDGSPIDDVDYEQDFAHRGIYSVTLETGANFYVRSTGKHEWEVVEEVNEDHVEVANVDDARSRAFKELAAAQRDAPELAMLAVQTANSGGVLSYVVEHVGDLTHRMAQYPDHEDYYCGWEMVEPKVRRSLDILKSGYGFEREAKGNNIANAKYRGISVEEFEKRLNASLDAYASAHKKLRVYNAAQWLAREAAISLGERNWKRAIDCLQGLRDHLGNQQGWADFASSYSVDFDKEPRFIV